MAGNRNERPAPSRFPKQRRSNPKNDVRQCISIGNAKLSHGKKGCFLMVTALGQTERRENNARVA